MSGSDRSKWLQKVYNARNNRELVESYDAWAENYERDVSSFGYKIPAVITGLIGRYLSPDDGPLLDAGAGTGILGEILASLGYKNLVGIDLSRAMLDVAGKKGVYHILRKMVLGEYLDFPDNTFAAVVSVGVFTANHAPPESFEELIRITKPGGYIIFSLRTDKDLIKNYKKKQDTMESEGKWELIEVTDTFQSLPLGEPEVHNQVFVYRVS